MNFKKVLFSGLLTWILVLGYFIGNKDVTEYGVYFQRLETIKSERVSDLSSNCHGYWVTAKQLNNGQAIVCQDVERKPGEVFSVMRIYYLDGIF